MGTETVRSIALARTGGNPATAGRSSRPRHSFGIVAVVTFFALLGCSREPGAHIGEWDGHLFFKDFTDPLEAHFQFHPDGRVNCRLGSSRGGAESREGKCRVEYDKFPPRLYIDFSDGTSLNGLVHYFGRGKTIMHVGVVSDGPPSHVSETKSYYLLARYEGKGSAASD